MTDHRNVAELYLESWNAESVNRTETLQGWSRNASYVDPLMSGHGRDGIGAMIEGAVAHFPGHRFALEGTPDGHGSYVRFSWTLAPEGGAAVARGTDVVRLDDEGKIAEVIGFIDGGVA